MGAVFYTAIIAIDTKLLRIIIFMIYPVTVYIIAIGLIMERVLSVGIPSGSAMVQVLLFRLKDLILSPVTRLMVGTDTAWNYRI